jgi:hypothetical protein
MTATVTFVSAVRLSTSERLPARIAEYSAVDGDGSVAGVLSVYVKFTPNGTFSRIAFTRPRVVSVMTFTNRIRPVDPLATSGPAASFVPHAAPNASAASIPWRKSIVVGLTGLHSQRETRPALKGLGVR